MDSDASSPWPPAPRSRTDSVRRQVVDAAAELMRGTSVTGTSDGASGYAEQSELNLYLALLTDRLPVYARTMKDLDSRVGEASVAQNLSSAAQATIDFYNAILAAKLSVFTKPEQLLQLRRVLKSHDLGPQTAHEEIAAYLDKERRLGRVAADVDCGAAARLLIGAGVNYAFTKLLLDDVTPRDAYVAGIIGGLRLGP
jgi:hypothetical protein